MLRTLFVLTEVLLTAAALLAVITTLLDYHLIVNRLEFTPTIYAPYFVCLAIIQMFYVRQQYRISFIFTANLVTLGLALPVLYFLPPLLYTMPIVLYYGVHTFIFTICDLFYWDHDKVSAFIRKQTWVNKIYLLENMLPKKNINAYILSSAASFCYSSLNLCILLSYKTMAILEYIALGFTCTLLIFSGIITFALLVKYDDAGNVAFPGCLLIHYIIQTYKRCENLISGNVMGSLSTGAVGAYLYSNMPTDTEDVDSPSTQVEDPQKVRIRELEGQVKGLETENTNLKKALENEQNKTFFQRYLKLKCFGKQRNE